jgi:hypothetical protein
VERGCIFVGHGLHQCFWTAILTVADGRQRVTLQQASQSLHLVRILVKFRPVHDSVEDPVAAYEFWMKAVEWNPRDNFDKLLNDLYKATYERNAVFL